MERGKGKQTQRRLEELIKRLVVEPLSWGPEEGVLITAETGRTARRLLEILPTDCGPKIAPDGEGGLFMAWEKPGGRTVVIGVSGDELYAVVGPGTAESRHIQETKFEDADAFLAELGG